MKVQNLIENSLEARLILGVIKVEVGESMMCALNCT